MRRRLNSLLGFAPTLVLRRAGRDAALLLTVVAVLASSVFLAVALPRLMLSAVDSGAQEAVAEAGADADVEIRTAVGAPVPRVQIIRPEAVLDLAAGVPGLLPSAIARGYPNLVVTVLSPAVAVTAEGRTEGPRLTLQLGMLTPAATAAITLTDGSLPAASRVGGRTEIDVVLSSDAAEAASLAMGDVIEFRDANVENVVAVVAGIIEATDDDAALWQDLPTLWAPARNVDGTAVALTVLTSPAGITAAEALFSDPFTATLRLKAEPSVFSSDLIAPVAAQLSALQVDGSRLAGDSGADLTVRSGFGTALGEYPGRARAAVAQMSVLISGVLAVAVAVIALLSRLLVARRVSELSLERARGASLASILVRTLLESVAIAALGAGLGLAAVWVMLTATASDAAPITLIAVVGIGAAPTQVALLISLADRGARRTAANRADRREEERRRRARRLVLEGLVVVVAAAALFAVRTRGLLQTRTDGVDPLLAAAPVALAAALVVLVLRAYPLAVRLAMSIGRRSRGALGTLGAMQAERALAVLPLASLTLAVALAVSGGLFVETVRSGQVDASWQRTGAEARLEAPLTQTDVAAVAARPGVTAASGVLTVHEAAIAAGTISSVATLLAVDPEYGKVLEQLPSVPGIAGDHNVSALFEPVAEGDPLKVLVDSRLARQLSAGDVTLTVGGETRELIPVDVVGTFDGAAGGYDRGPFIYVDRAALITRVSFTVEVNTLLVMGPGAVAAAGGLGGELSSRAQWLVDRQHRALVAGVNTVMIASTASVAGLALIGLIASVLAGSRSRRRSLSLLRTLGMHARLGWWLAASELAPLVLAALVGGIVAGVGIVLALGPAFGLETLAGGVLPPTLTISPWVIVGVASGAVLLSAIAMLAEVAAHRLDRLSDVLRVGDSQ